MNWVSTRETAVQLLRHILPLDLRPETPVYVIGLQEASETVAANGDCFQAYTSPVQDLVLRDHLERAGRWVGRGFATVVAEQHFVGASVHSLADTLLHELAHWYEFTQSELRTLPIAEWSCRSMADVMTDPVRLSELRQGPQTPFSKARQSSMHGWRFVRAALHIAARTGCKNFHARDRMHIDGFGLTDSRKYYAALYPEIVRRQRDPLDDVLADDPPAEFIELAAADLLRLNTTTGEK